MIDVLTPIGPRVPTVVYYGILAIVSYLPVYVVYNVFLHPLSGYPGPFLAKLSDAYNGYHAAKRRIYLQTRQNHLKYGSVVRQAPNRLVFNSVTALQDIYKSDYTTKPEIYITLGPRLKIPTVFSAQDRHLHRTRRQLVGQAVSDRSMRIFEPTMLEQVDLFMRHIFDSTRGSSSSTTATINMTERARLLGFELAGLLAFGYDFSLQTRERNRFILPMLEGGLWWSSMFLHWPFIRNLSISWAGPKPFRLLRLKYLSLIEHAVTTRTKQDKDAQHDLYSVIADHLNSSEPDGIRETELWAEATVFLPAAGDTTKTALAATFFHLAHNVRCYNKLAAEIRSNFTSGSEIRGQTLASCHYLRACIDEALRMSPPVPGILWREAYPSEQPFTVDGHVIPHGTIVGVNIYSVHYNEEYFPDPFTFKPERWLDDANATHDAFAPFSLGPRGCAGKAMAYLEVSLVVAKTLWYFDFRPAAGDAETFELLDNFTSSHDGPHLKFRQRGDFCKEFEDSHVNL
ncbi:cytochrome P450 [Xylaria intraflava]|nr:cytochrome P450 [Xylaria intraflava]